MSSLPTLPTLPVTATPISSTTFGIPTVNSVGFLFGVGSAVRPYCFAYQNSAQTLSAGVLSTVTLQAEVKDTDNMHGTSGVFTVVTAGLYSVVGQVGFPSTASGQDSVFIEYNSTIVGGNDTPFRASAHRVQATCYVQCVVGDTITLQAQSTSGGALTGTGSGTTYMQAFWVSE